MQTGQPSTTGTVYVNFAPYLSYLTYLGTGALLIAMFMALYELVTPYRELKLIREGNTAAALCFAGAMVGFTLTLASSAIHSATLGQFVLWGLLAGVTQFVAYFLAAAVVGNLKQRIENDNIAAGIATFSTAVALGILNAASLS